MMSPLLFILLSVLLSLSHLLIVFAIVGHSLLQLFLLCVGQRVEIVDVLCHIHLDVLS